MKKSFVYLICVLLMAAMLCGCGVSSTDSGMVSSSPAQTLPTASATVMPTTSPMASADAGTGGQTSSADAYLLKYEETANFLRSLHILCLIIHCRGIIMFYRTKRKNNWRYKHELYSYSRAGA